MDALGGATPVATVQAMQTVSPYAVAFLAHLNMESQAAVEKQRVYFRALDVLTRIGYVDTMNAVKLSESGLSIKACN